MPEHDAEPVLPPLSDAPVVSVCKRSKQYLVVAHGAADRLRAAAAADDHPHRRDDQYRAMVVFACAGVDRVCKSLIEDAVPAMASVSLSPEKEVSKFAERYLAPSGVLSISHLAKVLVDPYGTREALLRAYRDDLVGDSLQSVEQMFRVEGALQLDAGYVKSRRAELAETFRVRNLIVHEMDLDREAPAGHRHQRETETYVAHAGQALALADHVVHATSDRVLSLYRMHEHAWAVPPEDQELL